jgi:hypothetical protein
LPQCTEPSRSAGSSNKWLRRSTAIGGRCLVAGQSAQSEHHSPTSAYRGDCKVRGITRRAFAKGWGRWGSPRLLAQGTGREAIRQARRSGSWRRLRWTAAGGRNGHANLGS